ncbi:hypothetical protein [Lentilitoribacter sp. EG35]|uniref:hypothetical protein n=1 Tax=Lentilitoribacter sp. EG35 TaxID=3234192 RepID=UPI0034609D4E
MRELNQPIFDRLADLREGTLFKLTSAVTEDNLLQWFREQISPMEHMVPAIMKCLEKLQVGWGEVGVSGNENTIHSACLLLAENLSEIVKLEERLCFSILPEEAEKLRDLMQNQAEGAIAELQRLPDELDQFVINAIEAEINGVDGSKELAITFELNDSWSDEVNRLFES